MTMKWFMATVVFCLTAVAVQSQEVCAYTWSRYIDDALLTKFETKTGWTLVSVGLDSNEVLDMKMPRSHPFR